MLQHSFVLDALETTAADTFLHFEVLIEEHRALEKQQEDYRSMMHGGHPRPSSGGPLGISPSSQNQHHHRSPSSMIATQQSRLKQLVPTIGSFHTPLPLREAFEMYNEKHRLVGCVALQCVVFSYPANQTRYLRLFLIPVVHYWFKCVC